MVRGTRYVVGVVYVVGQSTWSATGTWCVVCEAWYLVGERATSSKRTCAELAGVGGEAAEVVVGDGSSVTEGARWTEGEEGGVAVEGATSIENGVQVIIGQ